MVIEFWKVRDGAGNRMNRALFVGYSGQTEKGHYINYKSTRYVYVILKNYSLKLTRIFEM